MKYFRKYLLAPIFFGAYALAGEVLEGYVVQEANYEHQSYLRLERNDGTDTWFEYPENNSPWYKGKRISVQIDFNNLTISALDECGRSYQYTIIRNDYSHLTNQSKGLPSAASD